ncbi:PREDICTED: cas scaffolding protein family member 4 [Galeopterus variegatus]|uniref:Cas scaffolding protein family member 4 n=1 Tax=Galeopterus variegatus TaxID=482537 RepID=A0ABM0RQU5_GALVR|nr:PREDICTED: cas scaffolding protein family member 4 [Galeopterus variegatus]
MDSAPKTLLARALYDNRPDCSDELAFCRGDILTILEQNVPESEGWWKCLLHGKQGLAPANRLQILMEAPADGPCASFLRGLEEAITSPEETYQVPTLLHPPSPGPVYEQMKSWVEGTPPATAQVYKFSDPPSSARIICEKTLSFPKQALFTLPRPARASLPTLPSQVYDVPAQSRVPSALKEPEKQQLYDIPASPQKAGFYPPASQASGQSVPLTSTISFSRGSYSTLPNPQKSEWIYDTPVSLGKANVRNTSLTSFVEESGSHAVPRSISTFHNPTSRRAESLPSQPHNNVPRLKKLSLPEISSYGFAAPRDMFPLDEDVSYKVPSSFLIPRVERQNTKPNIYDIPKAIPSVPHAVKELGKVNEAPENSMSHNSSWCSRQTTNFSPEPDRLSISSSDSRASVVSSCSSMSTDSSSSSSSEESAKEPSLDLDLARETVMALQHKVVSSAAGLMLFVSRKWRFRDCLEANIDAIHRAADHIEESVREFLEFAQGVRGIACNLTNSNLQARIRDQLQTISNSYQILLETKESLDRCNWSLEVLVTDKVQNSLDDLERFVTVARMIPEDIKRFASIVIANGRLLFKQNCEKEDSVQLTPNREFKCEKFIRLPQREIESHQRTTPFNKQGEHEHSPELLKKNRTNICGQTFSTLIPKPLSQQTPEKKIHLSEHCRLYFGALFKAISVFNSSLSNSQPPEVFISQSKLVIMVGQKLVDTLCKETQERDVRNEILLSSSHLCSLLKDLALATKNAVLKYPSPAALGHLQDEAEKLEQHTRQFRGTLE